MRKLNGGDIFPALRLLRAMDLTEPVNDLVKAVGSAETESDKNLAGFAFIGNCLEKAVDSKDGEHMIFAFLAGPLEKKSAEEVRSMELNDLADAVIRLMDENDLAAFFTKVKRIMRM